MQRSSRPEIVGLVLLGIGLLGLSVSLRAAQPGSLALPDYLWPASAAVVYIAAAFVMGGPTVRAILLFAAMAGAHTLYASLMGCAFASLAGEAGRLSLDPIVEGLAAYPPAVLLQMGFVIPFGWVLVWPLLDPQDAEASPGCGPIDDANTPEELLNAVLTIQAMPVEDHEAALAHIAHRARLILSDQHTPSDVEALGGDAADGRTEEREAPCGGDNDGEGHN